MVGWLDYLDGGCGRVHELRWSVEFLSLGWVCCGPVAVFCSKNEVPVVPTVHIPQPMYS